MDLAQRRQQLRQKQVDKVKKFRQSNQSSSTAITKQKEREQMKKEIRKEIENENQNESINIENSDGVTFARVMDIVGPSNMKPLVSGGLWKGTEQISEKKSDCECDDCGQDPCIECGESHHNVKEEMKVEKDDAGPGTENQQQKQIDAKQKKADQIKKQVLLKKLQAVRQGGGSEIMASYDWKSDKSMRINKIAEGSLHKWFNSSKSKDGKKGWVQSDGSPCANEPGETKTPKCYSSSKRASMSKKELRSADARKSRQDPNQQQKSGAAKPTYVATDKKKKSVDEACWAGYTAKGMKKKGKKVVPNCVKEGEVVTESDKKGKGSGKKDACYHKVKASSKVWPSAYASGRLVQCRKKGAGNYGKSKSESYSWRDELDYVKEGAAWTKKAGKNKEGGLNEKGRKSYERENPGSDLKAPQPEGGSRKKSFCARMGGMKKKLTSSKTANDPDSRINKALRKWKC